MTDARWNNFLSAEDHTIIKRFYARNAIENGGSLTQQQIARRYRIGGTRLREICLCDIDHVGPGVRQAAGRLGFLPSVYQAWLDADYAWCADGHWAPASSVSDYRRCPEHPRATKESSAYARKHVLARQEVLQQRQLLVVFEAVALRHPLARPFDIVNHARQPWAQMRRFAYKHRKDKTLTRTVDDRGLSYWQTSAMGREWYSTALHAYKEGDGIFDLSPPKIETREEVISVAYEK